MTTTLLFCMSAGLLRFLQRKNATQHSTQTHWLFHYLTTLTRSSTHPSMKTLVIETACVCLTTCHKCTCTCNQFAFVRSYVCTGAACKFRVDTLVWKGMHKFVKYCYHYNITIQNADVHCRKLKKRLQCHYTITYKHTVHVFLHRIHVHVYHMCKYMCTYYQFKFRLP